VTDAHQNFVRHVARHDPEGAIAVEKQLEKQDVETSAIDDASIRQLKKAEDAARLEFARKFYRLRKREPEGSWDEATRGSRRRSVKIEGTTSASRSSRPATVGSAAGHTSMRSACARARAKTCPKTFAVRSSATTRQSMNER